ncbi:GIY-YIG nuclease family protein [Burkholderia dolosa]|uniref:GIY-YIG nuclease family protein n=1 Tax=Burkholderia dolosa TaxID=152500 RepID=A0A892I7B2_9BURK|nr:MULTISPECIES: GIY-YIG nuclease family protein [Burkholderia]AKE02996.1 excinuclease ABC subunit C [Burkholderia cepacia]AJY12952.1 GIY-YIG catalytic domain protein [Burkholderia dolosa AU0158]AYZ97748.1 GIY-YIG nuclease family protein [Burkholderia dolosa]ETP64819.1 excinuclease [Burkholderia dolosa PC543]MBR8421032.1 GIY-YIG nuclease family protein [Burkholderia dolosa]
MSWFLYLIECVDDSVYTGITTDVAARFDDHAAGKGARYTRSRKPRAVLASFPLPDRSTASRAEYWVKRLTAAQKRELAAGIRTLDSVLPPQAALDGADGADETAVPDAPIRARPPRNRAKTTAETATISTAESTARAKKTAKPRRPLETARAPASTKPPKAAPRAKPADAAPAPAPAPAATATPSGARIARTKQNRAAS